ncbi:calcineurin-like phosphoesterase family protein [Fodinibius salsisoli]|uniref:Calcineurin-like phosphoesterase family protein n=1 Tax=Fodinibius salsisoli TaxID=2820877 RepID=A0ABT3PS47_9BACT|nr:calcineurin-like phosphoesterase family protein [Fodinibius salsisoli]MCW9708680.1 calcineurin-like phosphoesterase family protein [Fodinibius salsisoli]
MKLRFASILILGFCLLGSPARAQQTATGTVYRDANANGQLDSGDEGIAGVPVSNGQEVVLTDAEGTYSIDIDEQDSRVFVIKPSGYQLPVDELNRPRFYYLHKPNGSPDLDFEGVEPTGTLPKAINFPLIETEQKDEFQALIFGDPQPYTRQEVDYFDRDIVSELHDATEYDFGISLGDLVGDDLDLFQPYSESVAKVGIPWFNVYGNHDMNFDAQSDELADETFEATFGPATYSFNHGKAHFIILDDVIYPRTDGVSGYIGGLTDRQLDFIENDLKHVPKDHLVVLAFHIPIPEGDNGSYRLSDRRDLFDLLKEYPNTLSLSAHTHIQQFNFFDVEEDWDQLTPHIHYNVGTTSGDWWSGVPDDRDIPPTLMRDGTPNGYAMLNVDGNSFTIDYKAADYSEDYKMSIWGPKVVPQDSWHGAQLYVNYFLGNQLTEVEYRVKEYDDAWRTMYRAETEDPYVAELRQKWDGATSLPDGKRPSNPIESSHLWKGGVPNNLPLGEQVIEVRVTDMFGRTFTNEFQYRVAEAK